jgi:phage terminase small subunit
VGRVRSPNRDKAKKMYLDSNKTMLCKDIAKKLGVSESQVRNWKAKDDWDNKNKIAQSKKKSCATNKNINKKVEASKVINEENNTSLEIDELTERQRLFAEEFVRVPIAYKAAIKAGYSLNCAFMEGSRLMRNDKVKAYINYLKKLKRESIMLDKEDIVDKYMRIAFSDMNDYVEFGQERLPMTSAGVPVMMKNPATGKDEILTHMVSSVRLKESFEVDGEIITEIKAGKQGVSIKLEDRMKALEWLTNFFEMNPLDKHKIEYDNARLELERKKVELAALKSGEDPEEEVEDDGFIDALKGTAQEDWSDEED